MENEGKTVKEGNTVNKIPINVMNRPLKNVIDQQILFSIFQSLKTNIK